LWGLGSHQTSSITINTDLYSAGYMQVFGSFIPFLNCWPSQVHFAIGVVAPEPWPKTFLASATGSAMKYPINQPWLPVTSSSIGDGVLLAVPHYSTFGVWET